MPSTTQNGRPFSSGIQRAASSDSQSIHGRGISASDLVASFMAKPSPTPPSISSNNAGAAHGRGVPSTGSSQDFLLKLLNQPKPSQGERSSSYRASSSASAEAPPLVENPISASLASPAGDAQSTQRVAHASQPHSPALESGSSEAQKPSINAPTAPTGASIFTYTNPFDQLAASIAASSAQNRTSKETIISENALPDFDSMRSAESQEHVRDASDLELSTNQRAVSTRSTLTSPPATTFSEGRAKSEALAGVVPDRKEPSSVVEALNEVGEQVDKEVQEALGEVQRERGTSRNGAREGRVTHKDEPPAPETLHEVAAAMKQTLSKKENEGVLEETYPPKIAESIKEVINDAAQGHIADSWDSDGEDTPGKEEEETLVVIHSLPMKPFSSVALKPFKNIQKGFVDDELMDIARLKKEFDQIDRTLVTSTRQYIVYGMSKNGGLRIIRQEDGSDKQIYRTTHDRIFNVAMSTAPEHSLSKITEALIGTGISGAVYWIPLSKPKSSYFDEEDMEHYGFVYPPIIPTEENASGGALKTRAKKSSRHPEFFAIGRGKYIYIVWPLVASSPPYLIGGKGRRVDSQKYLKDHCLTIVTRKAGKDFNFSEDDSAIATLDKSGRLQIWDIQELVQEKNGTIGLKNPSVELKTPLMSSMTVGSGEKPWPTSVQFIDKAQPYKKGTAMRYIIVGMKQNHTLQVWDLGLGKAVQELSFPHDKESDAICSVVFHPLSSFLVVGHPTRNSIYFMHFSAPKYNLPNISQAEYVRRLANKDPTLPKPDSTAILNGIREYSFAGKGQLRSLDILPIPSDDRAGDEPLMFELYVMHSKGVTCIGITKKTLGLGKENPSKQLDLEEEGLMTSGPISEPTAEPPEIPSLTAIDEDLLGASVPAIGPSHSPSKALPKELPEKKFVTPTRKSQASTLESAAIASTLDRVNQKMDAARATINGSSHDLASSPDKPDKLDKKKKKAKISAHASADAPSTPSRTVDDAMDTANADTEAKPSTFEKTTPSSKASKSSKSKSSEASSSQAASSASRARTASDVDSINVGVSTEFIDVSMKRIGESVSDVFRNSFDEKLSHLYNEFKVEQLKTQVANDNKHAEVLRLVSTTLSHNVEKSLKKMVQDTIQQHVVPSVVEQSSANLRGLLKQTIPHEIKNAIPEAMSRSFQSPETLRAMSGLVADKVATHVETELSNILHSTISPAFKRVTMEAIQQMASEVEQRTAEQFHRINSQRQNDSIKIDQLTQLVHKLAGTVENMTTSQNQFQQQIVGLQESLLEESRASAYQRSQAGSSKALTRSVKTEAQEEFEMISQYLMDQDYENALIAVSQL